MQRNRQRHAPVVLTPGKKHGNGWSEGGGGARAGLEVCRDGEISERDSNSGPSTPEYSSYTDWDTAVPPQQCTATKFLFPKLYCT